VRVVGAATPRALAGVAADWMCDRLRDKPQSVLALPTGATPLGLYSELTARSRAGAVSFEAVRIFNLDEYCGLPQSDPHSYAAFLHQHLIAPAEIAVSQVHLLRGDAADMEAECRAYDAALADCGGIDLCVLGLGMNGHIGMNEPGATLQVGPHVARLSEVSLRHPMLANSPTRPIYGLTLGMGDIMSSPEILLLVSGANKRKPLQQLMQPAITTQFPASFLWLHSNCHLLCDRDAAHGLKLTP